ncbi:hypothetical protein [Fimbriimonas ginsengisoli]|uniref:Uncharacterized protein n=1 Tax=Fimbriimonas ginsengisoli Gsoil 348 TaxID=661478 RepID=A0A068NMH8_FIMGI|nr:hypothetical protein [Fimbriimonas ginsengisoli]AIE84778.1 hypothetical protein OP10G_1410 [Fimbriimonas ginsengisoli Gsoil 348]
MLREPPDLPALLKALSAAELKCVLIGGMAVILHGGAIITGDTDLAISFDSENRRRVVEALAPLNPRPVRLAPGAAWVWDEKCIRGPWSLFQTDAGRLDLVVQLPGVDNFDGLWERSEVVTVAGYPVRLASLDDLIALKSSSEREKDRLHVMELMALKRLRDEGFEG